VDEPLEIERKFLLSGLPDGCDAAGGALVEQGYLSFSPHEVRLREQAGHYFLTVKTGHGLLRQEREILLTHEQFLMLWPVTKPHRLRKRRWVLPWEQNGSHHRIEIDCYLSTAEPLWVAEVEFPSISASEAFQPPDFLGPEVTGDPTYANATLARMVGSS
jgi:adenylate cyclase